MNFHPSNLGQQRRPFATTTPATAATSRDQEPPDSDSDATVSAPVPQPTPAPQADLSAFTMTVDEVVAEFVSNNLPTTPRSVQRWCGQHKLRAVQVDQETRQPSYKSPWMYLIDATSVATRIRQLHNNADLIKQTQERPTAVIAATSRDPDATRREDDATVTRQPQSTDREGEPVSAELAAQLKRLQDENMMLKIDKAARDQVIAAVKEDRKELIGEFQQFVEKVAIQAQEIGQLKQQLLQLEAPSQRERRGGDNPQQDNLSFSV